MRGKLFFVGLGAVLAVTGCSAERREFRDLPKAREAAEMNKRYGQRQTDSARLWLVASLAEILDELRMRNQPYPHAGKALELGGDDARCFSRSGGFRSYCRNSTDFEIELDIKGLSPIYTSNSHTFSIYFTLEEGFEPEDTGIQFTEPVADWLEMSFAKRSRRLERGRYQLTPEGLEFIGP